MFVRNTEKGALCHEIHIVENFLSGIQFVGWDISSYDPLRGI